ncbi:MerR family transcriptional regulator [Vibrio sp. FNV 38]|nr:MerR family transcriptional regulator [Vibrio sp. FNV 38]
MGCNKQKYAIREISELTGVKPVTLRAWQRRYSLIQPERTDKGHRVYTQAHVEMIREIQGWLVKGVAIGKVKDLLGNPELAPDSEVIFHSLDQVEPVLTALAELKSGKVDALIAAIFKDYPLQQVESHFIEPIMEALVRVKGSSRSIQKALFQSVMISRLSSIIESGNKVANKGHTLVINLDYTGSIFAWLWCIKVAETGQRVTMLDGVDDATGLLDIEAVFDQMSLFSNRALPEATKECISQLKQSWGDHLVCSPMIEYLS